MKKLFTLTATLIFAFTASAQRHIDWSLDEIMSPTSLVSDPSSGTRIDVSLSCKNNGSDTLHHGDSIVYNFIAIDLVTSNILFEGPAGAAANGTAFIVVADKDVAPGDTISVGNTFNTSLIVTSSRNIRFGSICATFTLGDGPNSITDSVAANNQKFEDIVWFNQYQNGVSIENVIYNDNISVYPNPAQNEVNVELLLTNTEKVLVEIVDMNGKTVVKESANNTFNNIHHMNTSSLENGFYIIKVTNGDDVSTSKLTISK